MGDHDERLARVERLVAALFDSPVVRNDVIDPMSPNERDAYRRDLAALRTQVNLCGPPSAAWVERLAALEDERGALTVGGGVAAQRAQREGRRDAHVSVEEAVRRAVASIIADLAALDPIVDVGNGISERVCALCRATNGESNFDPIKHATACPWRRARIVTGDTGPATAAPDASDPTTTTGVRRDG